MSTNCLVTKMKGSVNNDNLPIFGRVKLLIEHVDNATDSDKWCVILAGSSPCKVTFVNTTPLFGPYAGKTEVTLPANSAVAAGIDLSGNNISVIVDAYSMAGFQQNHVTDIIDYKSLKDGEFINGSYNKNYTDVRKKVIEVLNTKTGIKYLSIKLSDETIARNVSTLISCHYSIDPVLVKDSTIKVCWVARNSNIEYIPATIKMMYINDGVIGSLTTLVNKFRAAGRVSGKIYVAWLNSNTGCTIDNGSGTEIPVYEYVTAHGLPKQEKCYLYWTADTIGITIDGTDVETYPTASWFQAPYV